MKVIKNKTQNILNAKKFIEKVVDKGANFVILPEMFNCPYNINYFKEYSENINNSNSETINFLKEISVEKNIYLVGGTIPEIDNENKIYNTCLVFDNKGNIIGKHRKIHLFDINIPDKIVFEESKVLSSGNEPLIINTEYGKIGIGICYDIRFHELSRSYRDKGAEFIIFPAAFNMVTGPLHWEILGRSRAIDNQLFVALVSSSRSENKDDYQSYGNSMLINSKGEILNRLDFDEGIIYNEINLKDVYEIRKNIPIMKQNRSDLFELNIKY